MMTQLAHARRTAFARLVNLDGLPYMSRNPDVPEHKRTHMLAYELAGWLEHPAGTPTPCASPAPSTSWPPAEAG